MKKAILIVTVLVLLALLAVPVVAGALTEASDLDGPAQIARGFWRKDAAESPAQIARGGCRAPAPRG